MNKESSPLQNILEKYITDYKFEYEDSLYFIRNMLLGICIGERMEWLPPHKPKRVRKCIKITHDEYTQLYTDFDKNCICNKPMVKDVQLPPTYIEQIGYDDYIDSDREYYIVIIIG